MVVPTIFLFIVAVLAFGLSAVCGGGASFILIPVLGWVLPGVQVPAALSIGTASSSLSRIIFFWSKVRWNIVLWFVPPALPAVWVGAMLLSRLNPLYLELMMGIFLLTNLPMLFKTASNESSESKAMPKYVLLLIGLVAGFVSGLTGAVGLLFNRFYLRYGMSKEEIVATRAANELLLHLFKLLLYASFGLMTAKAMSFGLVVALAAFLSSWMMKRLLPHISEKIFRRVGYGAMVALGLVMFSNAFSNLVNQNQVAMSYQPIAEGSETKLQWRKSSFTIEFEYDGGFELERPISAGDLPAARQAKVKELSEGSDKVLIEEVFGINKHYYEAYVYKNGMVKKYDI